MSLILSFQSISLTEHLSLNNRLIFLFPWHNNIQQFPLLLLKKEQAIALCRLS